MDIDRRILSRASCRHGVVTTHELIDAGLSHRQIATRVNAGWLERLHPGVYRIGGSVRTFDQLSLAACQAIGGKVAVSHRAAAMVWGLDLPEPAPVEVTVGATRSARLSAVVVHRSRDLVGAHVTRRHGLPVTKPARTLVDLGAVASAATLAGAFDDFVGRRLVTIAGVEAMLEATASRGRRGAGALRRLLDSRLDDHNMSRTRLEDLLIRLADSAGIQRPEFQYPILLGGRRRRIDVAFPALHIAIEVDGYQSHSRFDVFQDDRVRANELELAGWTVLRFTWHQLRDRPDYVVGVLRRALAPA